MHLPFIYESTNNSETLSFYWFILLYGMKTNNNARFMCFSHIHKQNTPSSVVFFFVLWCISFDDTVELVDSLRIHFHTNERCKSKHRRKYSQRHVWFFFIEYMVYNSGNTLQNILLLCVRILDQIKWRMRIFT